jgi:hypothetical protein
MAASRTTTTEMRVASNEVAYKRAFYSADSGIFYALSSPSMGSTVPYPVPVSDLTDPNYNKLTTPSDYDVYYLRLITAGPPKEVEIQSNSVESRGSVSIIAGVRFPTQPGALPGPGYQGTY